MKLHPPKAVIDPNDPFKNALYDRKEFAESLTALLRNINEGLVIFVNAPWGEGKTTFAEMWRAQLKKDGLDVIYFDAYASDYIPDPFVSFSGEILELVRKRLAKEQGLEAPSKEFKSKAVEVGKRLVGLGAKIGIKTLTLGAISSTEIEEIADIGKDAADGVAEIGADQIEKLIENYGAEKNTLKAFKESLAQLAKIMREQQGFPLTIIVDELDRCRPDFALGLLERIKHLFDVEGVAFVLLVNRDQIESYVRTVYGESVDARAYLLKFANLFVDLPNQSVPFRAHIGRREFCESLFDHHEIAIRDSRDFFMTILICMVDHFKLTLREIQRVFSQLALYFGSLPQNELSEEFLIVLLAILRVQRPIIFTKLATEQLSYSDFIEETKFLTIKNQNNLPGAVDWGIAALQVCLLTDPQLEAAKLSNSPTAQHYSQVIASFRRYRVTDRSKVIPFFCNRLNRYLLKPA